MAGVTSARRGTLGGSLGIINGKKAKQGQFPYQVGITMDGQYFCGGSIISEDWVLTAGHCVDGCVLGLRGRASILVSVAPI